MASNCYLPSHFDSQEQSNVGAASVLYYRDTARRLQREIAEKAYETEEEKVAHEMAHYVKLLSDPSEMAVFRDEVAHRRERRLELADEERELQEGIEIVRQNVTFVNCQFLANSYGERSEATNYGTIGIETDDNDVVVDRCIFTGNQFGDENIVVRAITC